MVPLASQPSAFELKELCAIAADAALQALMNGSASGKFHGFEIQAVSCSSVTGRSVRVLITDACNGQTLSHEHLRGSDGASRHAVPGYPPYS